MKHIRFIRFLSLLVSFTLLIAPLPLSSMVEKLVIPISDLQAELMSEDINHSYIYLGKELSNISYVISEISVLEQNNYSPLTQFKNHVENGLFLASYDDVTHILHYAEHAFHTHYTALNPIKAKRLSTDLDNVIQQFMNGSLSVKIGDKYYDNNTKRSYINIITVQGLLSVNDEIVQRLTAINLSVTDAIIQNATIGTLSTTDQFIQNISTTNLSATDETVTGTLSVNDEVIDNTLLFNDASGGEYVGLQAPTTIPSSYILSLPSTIPTANQVLRANATTPTDLEWVTAGGSVPPTAGKTIYVTKFGNDVTGNGSFDTPYATLAKAITTANGIASLVNPIVIFMSAGIYTENNSGGALAITANGISLVGESASGVIVQPNTPANNLLSVGNTVRIANLTFQSPTPLATGISLTAGNLTVLNDVRIFNFLIGVNCSGGAAQSYGFNSCLFVNNVTALAVSNSRAETNTCSIFGTSVATGPAVNTGIDVIGSGASVVLNAGVIGLCTTGMSVTSNAIATANSINFRLNAFDTVQNTASRLTLAGCTFELTDSSSDIDIQVSDAGTVAEIISCEFSGASSLGATQGTGIVVSNDGTLNISGGVMHNYTTGIQIGDPSDTSSTTCSASGLIIRNCTTDLLQQGTTTLLFDASTGSSSKIIINDATNVELAFFDLEDNGALTIGSTTDQDTSLIQVDIDPINHPGLNYKSSLYSTQAIGFENIYGSSSSLYSLSANNADLSSITTDSTKFAGLRLVSDTGSPVGGTTALRGWDINKNSSTAELSFTYQNSDIVGQSAVSPYIVMQLDGVNNLLQLPTAGAQIVFATDTNLYRSSANVLKTDDNFIVGTLTPDRVVVTAPVTNQLASSVVTGTELGYLSGVTSPIQTQLNGKVSKTGDTMTGALQLPAGTAAVPSLRFTGSTTTGLSAATANTLSFDTNGIERLNIDGSGNITIDGFTTAGVVHNSAAGLLSSSLIVNADVDPAAAIVDTKLATISTAGKVANSATTATSANTASAIVARDASGNFSAGTITANLIGNATTATTATNFSGSLSGDVTGTQSATVVSLVGGQTAANVAAATVLANAATSVNTASTIVKRTTTGGFSAGAISVTDEVISNSATILPFNSAGVVHNDSSGLLSSSLIVNADITNATISNAKLATISSNNTPGNIVVRDGLGNFSTNMITIAGTTTNATDVATKSYVDSAVSTGLVAKNPAVVVSTSNQALSGLPTIDGVTLSASDRVLLTGQTNPVENGLWVAAVGAWSRPADFASGSTAGQAYVLILSGTIYGGSSWLCSTPTAIIDTNPISFALFSLPNTTTGANVGVGTGLIFRDKTGNNINFKSLIQGSHVVITNNTDDITLATDATNANTASTIVARDASGNFSAGTITASLNGNATTATTATNFSGSLAGEVTGTQGATVVTNAVSANTASAIVRRTATGGFSAGAVSVTDEVISSSLTITPFNTAGIIHNDSSGLASSSLIVNADVSASAGIVDTKLATISTAGKVANSATTATSANTASAIVARDGSGNFSAGTITASLNGNATTATTTTNFSGSLAGEVTGTQGATVVTNAVSANTASAIVRRTATGGFSAGAISVTDEVISNSATITPFNTAGVVHNDASGLLSTSLIVNADVDPAAAIVDTKLATISTAGKVANSATTATSANTANAIVARDASGNFNAGTIIASLTGAASLNVLKAGDTMTGALQLPAGTTAAPSLVFTGSTTTGLSATAGALSLSTSATERLKIASGGTISIDAFTSTGVVHNDASGNLSSSLIVDADVSASAAIVDTKLATISTAGKVANSATTATSANTASTIVARDGSGNFSAGTITANLAGNATTATTATTATNFSGSLSGDVTGTQGATVVSLVGGQTAANVAAATVLANAATNLNTANAIVKRDSTGSFAAQVISMTDGVHSGNLNLTTEPSTSGAGNILKNGNRFVHDFGTSNTFVGLNAGNFTMSGSGSNVAIGTNALQGNTTGNSNVAVGLQALLANTTGVQNTGIGLNALVANTTGFNNTAVGYLTMTSVTSGNNNIALGVSSGGTLTTGSGNIYINANAAAAAESSTTRIGTSQTACFMQGIFGATTPTGTPALVAVDSTGKLGTATLIATSANTANAIVQRDGSGNFSAGTVTLAGNLNLTTEPSTSGAGNILKNGSIFIHDFGTNNTFVGVAAGNLTMTGSSNTGIGRQALLVNAAGSSNTAVGLSALQANTAGNQNIAIGHNALLNNTTGGLNTAVGFNSMVTNTTGVQNTAIGYATLANSTIGTQNTAVGLQALSANTTGNNNTCLGHNSLVALTTGSNNIAIGFFSGNSVTTGNNNIYVNASAGSSAETNTIRIGEIQTACYMQGISGASTGSGTAIVSIDSLGKLGTASLIATSTNTANAIVQRDGSGDFAADTITLAGNLNLTTEPSTSGAGIIQKAGSRFIHDFGTSNTFVGLNAGNFTMSGSGGNVALGVNALQANTTGSSNVALGVQALLANTTGIQNVGIGFNALVANTSGANNTAVGYVAMTSLTSGVNNIALGVSSGGTLTTGSGNIYINANASTAAEANTTRIGTSQTATFIQGISGASTGSGTAIVSIDSSGKLGTASLIATSANTANAIVQRDGSGNFSAGTVTLAGNLNLTTEPSTSTAGNILKNGTRFIHDTGTSNTFVGLNAGNFSVTGIENTAVGNGALASVTVGSGGLSANTAVGNGALAANTTGVGNTAVGDLALNATVNANNNTAVGYSTLLKVNNSAGNTGIGSQVMVDLVLGSGNTAVGGGALGIGTIFNNNTAIGTSALNNILTGSTNIALGFQAGNSFTSSESNNIVIGSTGTVGDSATIRIGSGTQTKTFIAGIRGVTTGSATGINVLIDTNGQLGTVSSTRRVKHNIEDMNNQSANIYQLRPVTFAYNSDVTETKQYGLIAEEVDEVFPAIVVRDEDDQPETVQYHVLPVLLLNEMQKQHNELLNHKSLITYLEEQLKNVVGRLNVLESHV